jgi:intracellular sulfur oxidation DsrE/DsrF family protein
MKEPFDHQLGFSPEHLNAFVDGQLADEEQSRLLLALNSHDTLSREVCELRKVRDLVRLAYPEPPATQGRARRHGLRLPAAAAMVATLTVGVMLGWLLHTRVTDGVDPLPRAPGNPAGSVSLASAVPGQHPSRIILHVSDNDPKRLSETLNDIEGLLRYYKSVRQNVRVEVVANGGGVALLRADANPHARRIAELQDRYDNLGFVACQNTLDRLAKEQGIATRLLPGVVIIDSGVAQLMRRQNQGWAYIQA